MRYVYLRLDSSQCGDPIDDCLAGTDSPVLSETEFQGPISFEDIMTIATVNNQPLYTELTLHSATPATDANKIDPLAYISQSGSYYVAFWDEQNNCYSPTTEIVISAFCTQPANTNPATNFTISGVSNRDQISAGWPGNVPNGFIALNSEDSGFVITRVNQASDIDNPIEGMLIYDILDACIKLYYNSDWHCIQRTCNVLDN